jgi:hypothetical protein
MKAKRKKAAKKPGRPATGRTPKRYFRIKDDAWQMVIDAAAASGETISDYLRRVLARDSARVLMKKGK